MHPITTEGFKNNNKNSKIYFESLKSCKSKNFIQFVPNNDDFSNVILKNLKQKIKKIVKILKYYPQ